MPAGRPSSYSEEILQKAKEYIAGDYKTVEDQIPTVIGLRKYLGVARSTIYKWAEEHEAFSDTLGDLSDYQQVALINGGLSGDMNPTITKLVLSANHGMHDREERGIDLNFGDKSDAELLARVHELTGQETQ